MNQFNQYPQQPQANVMHPQAMRPNTPYPTNYQNPVHVMDRIDNIYDRTAMNNVIEASLKTGLANVKGGAIEEIKSDTLRLFSEYAMGILLLIIVICIIVATTYSFMVYARNKKRTSQKKSTQSVSDKDPEIEKILEEYSQY